MLYHAVAGGQRKRWCNRHYSEVLKIGVEMLWNFKGPWDVREVEIIGKSHISGRPPSKPVRCSELQNR